MLCCRLIRSAKGEIDVAGSIDALFKALQGFCADADRTTPPVFVGRENELAKLELALKRTAGAEQPPRGMFRVVQGLPGAGKTALCERFLASIEGLNVGSRRTFGVKLHPADLSRPPLELAMQITEELPVGALQAHFRNLVSTSSQVLGAKRSIFEMTNANHGLSRDSGLTGCLNVYAERHWGRNLAIALAFDEMQACPPTKESIAALGVLHEALHKARIAVFCFGLQNTATHLREELKLSRLSKAAEMPLGPLEDSQGRQLVQGTLDALGVSTGTPAWRRYIEERSFDAPAWEGWRRRLVDEIDARSGNFPHHLVVGLLAAGEALCANRSSYGPDHDLLPEIVDAFETAKTTFYQQRLGSELEAHAAALGAFCKSALLRAETGAPRAFLLDLLTLGDDDGEMVDRQKAERLLRLADERGVLRKVAGRGAGTFFELPMVPSMAAHLAAEFDLMALRGNPTALELAARCGFDVPAGSECGESQSAR